MIGILFATRQEASPFLQLSSFRSEAIRPFDIFRVTGSGLPSCMVAVSGMGKVAAAAAASYLVLAYKVRLLINAGLCGRLTDDQPWAVGGCLRVDSAIEGDCDRFGRLEPAVMCDSRWFRHLAAARLVTCDRPVFDIHRRSELAKRGDLADMEGAAVARVAALYGIPCAMLKGISDTADEDGRQDLAFNSERVSMDIAETLINELAQNPLTDDHET